VIARYQPDRTLIWGKQVSQYPYWYNPILCFQIDPEYSLDKRIWTDALGIPSIPPSQKMHKYQDPVRLYRTILGMVDDCYSVLDPFMGSGTVLVAAQQAGMDAVEVDRAPECLAAAYKRLQQETFRENTIQINEKYGSYSGSS
jgi:site-specific DNA-methyltransferase (adenine-specific)